MSLYDTYIYYEIQNELYNGDPLDWLTAFTQNLIGRSIDIANMSKKIEITEENGDNRLKHFIIGHIVYMLLDFEPIEEMASFDYDTEHSSWTNIYKLLEIWSILL